MNRHRVLLVLASASIALNVFLLLREPKAEDLTQLLHDYRGARPGKDCSVEMKSLLNDLWHPVILVHGYADNYSVAKYIVDLTEADETARGGRPKGSFRVKVH
jgi:hypothetical protein